MPKDYSKKPVNKPSKSAGIKPWLRLLTSFIGGYFLATIFDYATLKDWISQHWRGRTPSLVVFNKLAKQHELPKPKFEFYTLLTKSQNFPLTPSSPVPVETATPLRVQQQTPPSENKLITNIKEGYFVQIASFKNRQDAERLKASLILKGFDATISIALQQQTSWFRVAVGPFNSRGEAEKALVALAKVEGVKGMIRKLG